MCGFFGIVSGGTIDLDLFNASTAILGHRGPDNQGIFDLDIDDRHVALGHRRLSIIDLNPQSHQPFHDCLGNYTIVFNGEVYNYKEIRNELIKLEVNFATDSDTEVVLAAYKFWGEKCVDRFIGMFAFIILDKRSGEVIPFRDRAGVKPLYYGRIGADFFFASELKAISTYYKGRLSISRDVTAAFLKRGWIGSPHSIFSEVLKLPPGCFLKYCRGEENSSPIQYWSALDQFRKPLFNGTHQEAKVELERLLNSACNYRMIADRPVGVFLSGGYDSTTVTALIQKSQSERLRTFSIGFENEEFNEAPYAKSVAEYLNTNHHELIVTEKDAFAALDRIPFFYDEPFGDSSAIPTMLVSQLASKDVKVALSADGGDEVFGGYTRYHSRYPEIEAIRWLKKVHLDKIARPLSSVFNVGDNPQKLVRQEKLLNGLNSSYFDHNLLRLRIEPIHFSDRELDKLMLGDVAQIKSNYDSLVDLSHSSDLRYMRAMEYQTTMVDDILVKVDRASMSYSLESREPLLDHRLIEFSARLPDNYLHGGHYPKRILRDVCHDLVPRKLVDRPKKGFAIPTESWMKGILKDRLLSFSSEEFIRNQGIFDPKSISIFIDNYLKGFDTNHERPWIFLMFQMWYNRWVS